MSHKPYWRGTPHLTEKQLADALAWLDGLKAAH
jgi:hypothetical protein